MRVIGVQWTDEEKNPLCGEDCEAALNDPPQMHSLGCPIRATAEWGEVDRPRTFCRFSFALVAWMEEQKW